MNREDLAKLALDGNLDGGYSADQISNDDYHKGPGLSASGTKTILFEGPSVFKHIYLSGEDTKKKSSDQQELGSAVHCAILEPDRFKSDYVSDMEVFTRTGSNRRLKVYQEEIAAIEAIGKTVLSGEDFDTCNGIRDSILNDLSGGGEFLFNRAEKEKSFYATDENGVLLKCRCDAIRYCQSKNYYIISDLKTTSKPLSDIDNQIKRWHYYVQAAHYIDVVERATGLPCEFTYVFVTTTPPYPVNFVQLVRPALERGLELCKKARKIYSLCRDSNAWPHYRKDGRYEIGINGSELFQVIDIPAYLYFD